MKRIFKAVTALIAVLCIAAGTMIFAACGNDVAYTVNILSPDGSGIAGVNVTLTPNDGAAAENEEEPFLVAQTNASGAAVFNIAGWADTTSLTVSINGDDLPAGYSVQSMHTVNISDGYTLNLTASTINYETVKVNLANKNATYEYEPAGYLEDGYYEFRCSNSAVSFTLTDGETFDTTEGCGSVIVNYKSGDIYDIGTANNETSFDVVFVKIDTTGESAEKALIMSSDRAIALNLGAGEKVYVNNPFEVDVAGTQDAGAPHAVSGNNFKATVDGKAYTEGFKVGSNKMVEITTADGQAGTVVLYFKSINNSLSLAVGESKSVEMELLERSIKTQSNSNPNPVILWESNLRVTFTVESAGTYRLIITNEEFADDLMNVDNIRSTGLIPVVPDRTDKDNPGANPYTATFTVTENNLAYAKTYTADVVTALNNYASANYKQGDKLTYTVKLEKV